jgi:hypothetical protein
VIARSIRSQTHLPESQKRLAWEQVRARAAQQAMLPPLAPAQTSTYPSMAQRLGIRARQVGRWTMELIFDDTPYDRALRQYRPLYHLGVYDSYLRNAQGCLAS